MKKMKVEELTDGDEFQFDEQSQVVASITDIYSSADARMREALIIVNNNYFFRGFVPVELEVFAIG